MNTENITKLSVLASFAMLYTNLANAQPHNFWVEEIDWASLTKDIQTSEK